MNDPWNLSIYTQLVRFQSDLSLQDYRYSQLDNPQQRSLQSMAHSLGLEYEYSLNLREARVARSRPPSNLLHDSSATSVVDDSDVTSRNTGSRNDVGQLDFASLADSDGFFYPEKPPWVDQKASSLDDSVSYDPLLSQQTSSGTCAPFNSSQTAKDEENGALLYHASTDDASLGLQVPNDTLHDQTFSTLINNTLYYTSPELPGHGHSEKFLGFENNSSLKTPEGISSTMQDGLDDSTSSFALHKSRATSQASSASSFGSCRARNRINKLFSRRSSSGTAHSSIEFEEFVFGPQPNRSDSRGSFASGRRGPLDAMTRTTMKALKAIGACWRCKFLRKSCDMDHPCMACPKGAAGSRPGPWRSVGCRRGTIESQMVPLDLCPRDLNDDSAGSNLAAVEDQDPSFHEYANDFLKHDTLRRDQHLAASEAAISSIRGSPRESRIGEATTKPLDQCISAISWELLNLAFSQDAQVFQSKPVEDMLLLLASAARYQAGIESDHLIAQSLICLRTCLEALRVQQACPLDAHTACEPQSCKFECIAALKLHITLYLKELSRVMFKKENLRNKHCWLSAFYSFCIQSVVRKCLLYLAIDDRNEPTSAYSGAEQYLHLALRLFVASNGIHDPLMRDNSLGTGLKSKAEVELLRNYHLAQEATQQSLWITCGIKRLGRIPPVSV